jgi:hypothetical protein
MSRFFIIAAARRDTAFLSDVVTSAKTGISSPKFTRNFGDAWEFESHAAAKKQMDVSGAPSDMPKAKRAIVEFPEGEDA